MGSVTTLRRSVQPRTVGIAVGASLFLVVLVTGVAFANSVTAGRVADNAAALHWTNATMGTSASARLALVQAATFVDLAERGQATQADVDFAMTQALNSRLELSDLQEIGGSAESLPFLTHFLGPIDDTIDALRAGESAPADALIMVDVESAYLELVESLQAEQAEIQARIDANTKTAARTTEFVRFFLMFAIPAAAVLIYRFIAKRAVREYQLKAELEIEKERAVGRAKDEFIAGLSHELRTPLTSIYGFAEVLTDGGVDDAAGAREMSQIIANEAAEMTRMVDDLLAAARIGTTGVEIETAPTRVDDVVESAILPFQRAGMSISFGGSDVMVDTDAARLRHVLVNLVSNAARHGGPQVGVEVSEGDDTVDIEVWDTGRGVPDDQVEALFDAYVHDGSSPLLTGSLGLGLAVASKLAELLGGSLSYQRFASKSYFIVKIPASAAAEKTADDRSVADVIRALSA